MDLHLRRLVLVRTTGDGRRLEMAKITNSSAELHPQIARAGSPFGGVVDRAAGGAEAA